MAAFDVVVVGAGSAGIPAAVGLSDDPRRSVLLIEAGPDYAAADTPPAVLGPNFARALAVPGLQWRSLKARATPVQPARSYVCGRGVGGTSAVNGQGAVRPLPGDVAAEGLAPLFARIEDDVDFGDRPGHGRGGPVPVSRTPRASWGAVSEAVFAAAVDHGLPERDDLNDPAWEGDGVAPAPWNRRDGRRVSTKDAFLEPVRGRPNLTLWADALVERVRIERGRAVGVELAGGRFVEAGAVVLCAGAIHSPALLLRSGVGPADDLRALGIPVAAALNGVGRNLADHPVVRLRVPLGRDQRAASPDVLPGHVVLRLSSGRPGALPCDIAVVLMDRNVASVESGGAMVALMQPTSTGRVRLRARAAAVGPDVVLAMLTAEDDVRRMEDAVRLVASLLRRAMGVDVSGGDQPVALAATPYGHAVGTCRIGPADDLDAVVDGEGRVYGVHGLRVADASVLPVIPRAPTCLSAVAVGVRTALFVHPAGVTL